MKARTKNQRRRGRKRLPDVPREPNGRVSRSGIPHESANVVALEARMRHTGLSRDKAQDQKAATFIGYLNLLGKRHGLSEDQYDAAVDYLDLRAEYLRAIKAPDATLSTGTLGASPDDVSPEYIAWTKRIRERYAECREAIRQAQYENRHANLWAALDYCIIRGEHHHHMVGATRIVCNALARFFRT